MKSESSTISPSGRQLIVISGGRHHALSPDYVIEVLRRPKATRVPHGPPALVGVFNLRGSVLPLISLAKLLGAQPGAEQHVVVLEHGGPIGLLVDAVPLIGEAADANNRLLDLSALLDTWVKRQSDPGATSILLTKRSDNSAQPVKNRVLVSFIVNGQSFALPLASVLEVLRVPDEISRVALADQTVMGVINLRNHTLPIISMSGLLGFPNVISEASSRQLLVIRHNGSHIGLVPDAITSVLRLDETAIDEVPAVLQRGQGEAKLDALGRTSANSLTSILSVSKLFADPVLKEVIAAEAQEEDDTMAMDQVSAEGREKYLIFELGDERYGLPIGAVEEVLRLPDVVTRLPNGPKFVTGIINLRGRPIPLIDQRQRFGVATSAVVARPHVIIVRAGKLQAGFVVDGASKIIAIASGELADAPQLSSEQSAVFNRVANIDGADGNLILIVDPEELLSRAEQDAIAEFTRIQTRAASQ